MLTGIILVVLGLVALASLAVALSRARLNHRHARWVRELLAARRPAAGRAFRAADLEGLPDAVRRYLAAVIPEGQPYVTAVRLRQTGEFRLGGRTGSWKPFTARQYFTADPPGFVWDATIMMVPLLPVRVIDMYRGGAGALQGKLLSTFTVAEAQGTPEIDAGELTRYLSECVWFPTALLPGQGVEWSAVEGGDDRSARATLVHGRSQVSAVFYFDEEDHVSRIHAERWYQKDDGGFELWPWTGQWRDYEARQGLVVPTAGEVAWNLPEGNLTYWRGRVEEIEYEPAGEAGP
jgi:hypothetical protein